MEPLLGCSDPTLVYPDCQLREVNCQASLWCVQGFWQNAWWISTVKEVEEDGTIVCLSDPTPVYPDGEEWEVEAENLRLGHPQGASGFGMLDLDLAAPPLPSQTWR